MIAFIALSLAHLSTPVQTVDLIEINHYFDARGVPQFSQVIFWDVECGNTFHVREWTMLEGVERDVTPQGYMRVKFKNDGTTVVGRMFRESWTMTDPEREDLKAWPLESRIPLARRVNAR